MTYFLSMIYWAPCRPVRIKIPHHGTSSHLVAAVHKVLSQTIVIKIVVITSAAMTVESILRENELETSCGCEIMDVIVITIKFMDGRLKVMGVSPLIQMRGENDLAVHCIVIVSGCMPFPITGNPIRPIHDDKRHIKAEMLACCLDCVRVK